MNIRSDELDAEEKKVLNEALSSGGMQVGPTEEYAAELRRRVLSATTGFRIVRVKPKRRVLLGSILGAGVAAIVAVLWFWNAEPAWASAIRRAREQAWIRARIERNGVPHGDIWVSPERDIVAARLGKILLFQDYRHETFLRYDDNEKALYRTFQPENPNLSSDLLSASSLGSMFRASSGAPYWLRNQSIEHWSLRSSVVDGIPCDEYEIVIRPPDRPPTTLFLAVDRGRSLPHSLTIAEGDTQTTSYFEYPPTGPVDAQALGIPVDAQTQHIDKTGKLSAIDRSLREERDKFDDYTALLVTSLFEDARPLINCEVKRVLRRGHKWRIDSVQVSDSNLVLPKEPDQALKTWRSNKERLHFLPLVICDGRFIGSFQRNGVIATNGRPFEVLRATDESVADGFAYRIPERSCRPSFHPGASNHLFDVTQEKEGVRDGLIRVQVLPTLAAKSRRDIAKTYWLDPSLGNVAVRIVSQLETPVGSSEKKPPSSSQEIAFHDFRQSPRGFWYPGVVDRDPISKSQPITRLYIDFADVPSDDLFAPVVATP